MVILIKENEHIFFNPKVLCLHGSPVLKFLLGNKQVQKHFFVWPFVYFDSYAKADNKKNRITSTDRCGIPCEYMSRNKIWINKWILCRLINLCLSEQGWKCLLMPLDPRYFNLMTSLICFVLLAHACPQVHQLFFVCINLLGSSISVDGN